MKPVNMTVPTDPAAGTFGDCARACVASIFELPGAWVPHFCHDGMQPVGPDGEFAWMTRLYAWSKQHGHYPVTAVIKSPDAHWPAYSLQFHHMRMGRGSLGQDHWVVYFGDKLVHDPQTGGLPGIDPDVYPQAYLFFVKA